MNTEINIKVRIDNTQFPYSFYNINANKNLLNYTYLGISYTMIITPGNYNEYSLAISIKIKCINVIPRQEK